MKQRDQKYIQTHHIVIINNIEYLRRHLYAKNEDVSVDSECNRTIHHVVISAIRLLHQWSYTVVLWPVSDASDEYFIGNLL